MTTRNFLLLIIALPVMVIFSACSSDDDDSKKGVLTHEQMVPILLDVYIAEGRVNELRIKRDSATRIFDAYEQRIFEKHGVSDSVYTYSLNYYYDHPEELEKIYETALDSLNLMEKRLNESKKGSDDEDTASEEDDEGKGSVKDTLKNEVGT